jgi:hypothetical protein
MQSFTPYDLYKICVKNGLSMSFSEFTGMPQQSPGSIGPGSCIKLVMGQDVVLNENFSVGSSGKYNLTVQLNVYNQTQLTLPNVTLHCVAVFDGLQMIDENTQTINKQASFTPDQVAAVPLNPDIKFKPTRELFGAGDFFSSLKSGLQDVNNFLKKSKLISSAAPILGTLASPFLGPAGTAIGSTVGNIASNLGYGEGYRRKPLRKPRIRGGQLDDEEICQEQGYEISLRPPSNPPYRTHWEMSDEEN